MRFLFIILLTLSSFAYGQYRVDFELTPDHLLLEKLLTPLWQQMNYDYVMTDKKTYSLLEESISYNLESARIHLGQKPHPLFKLSFTGANQGKLLWDFSKLTAHIKAKVRFKFKQYGVQVTHDEYFIIDAKRIGPSYSDFKLNYKDKKIFFSAIKNQGFAFEQIKVKPQDGVGPVLRYIFDHVFGEGEVDRYLKTQINAQLKKWINKNTLVTSAQSAANNALAKLRQTPIDFNQVASRLKVDINALEFSSDQFKLSLSSLFVYDHFKVHPCAQMMHRPALKDHLQISYNMIEQLINNYATYQIKDSQGHLQEPLFCFGYKEYADNGDPLGEKADFQFLGRKVKFTYWVAPMTLPHYQYFPEKQQIKIDLKLLIKVTSQQYPKLIASNNNLKTTLSATYSIEHLPGEGLNLIFQDFDLTSITGRAWVKWGRFVPAVRVPLSLMMGELEAMINQQAQEHYKRTPLISEEIDFLGGIKLLIDDYQMTDLGHKVIFRAR